MDMPCYLISDFDISSFPSNQVTFILKAWALSTFIIGSFVLIRCREVLKTKAPASSSRAKPACGRRGH